MKTKLVFLGIVGFLTLYACENFWIASLFDDERTVTHTVSFDTDGGSEVPSQTVAEGGMASRPENPTKDDYGFVAWYDNENLEAPRYDFNTPVTEDITLYAQWGVPRTVSFNTDGGSAVEDRTVGEGGTVYRLPADPTKDGYTFDNWYSDGLITLFDFDAPITSDITVYAKWNVIPVSGVTVSPTTLSLSGTGATGSLSATVAPSTVLNKNVTWSSDDENVATVDSSGVVTAVNGGTTSIIATTVELKADGEPATASCTVTVHIPVTDVELDETTLTLIGSGETATLGATVLPANADQNVIWSSSDNAVATVNVNTGVVTSVGVGEATITATTVGLRAVGQPATATCTVTVNPVDVTGVTLEPTTLPLNKGGTATLTATVAPANATNKTVTWSSNNTAVATVNSATGLITAVGGGTATITVTTEGLRADNQSATATCTVTVTVLVSGVTISPATFSLDKGGTGNLSATVAPSDASNKNVTWSSDTPSVATVNPATGEVTAVAGGTAIITVTTEGLKADGQAATATRTVTVNVPVSGVSLDPSTLDLKVGGETATLSPIFDPIDALNKNVTWSISPATGVATVSNTGVVTAVGPGIATITVRTADGEYTATCEVTVTQPVTSVTLNKSATSINVGGTDTLTATVLPANASNKDVTWESSNPSVASVSSSSGSSITVNAVGAGEAIITVRTNDGGFEKTCTVTVIVPVTNIIGVPTAATTGTPLTLTGTVEPSNATNQTITWSVINTGGTNATVSGSTLNTTAAGTVMVMATIANGATATTPYTKSFDITVSNVAVTNITGVPETAMTGTALTLTGTVAPENATKKTITWSVQDAGGTGATISGSTLNTTTAGTVTVRATIVGGKIDGTDYTQDFDITVKGTPQLTITIDPITDQAPTIINAGTISQSGSPRTLVLTVTGTSFDSYQWSIDGNIMTGETGSTLTVNAGTLAYNNLGTHTVYLVVWKGTAPNAVPYSKTVQFTVVE